MTIAPVLNFTRGFQPPALTRQGILRPSAGTGWATALLDLSWQCGCIGSLDREPAFARRLRRPALLVPLGDPSTLGAALRAWLRDPELRGRLRRAARERRETLAGWASTASALERALAAAS